MIRALFEMGEGRTSFVVVDCGCPRVLFGHGRGRRQSCEPHITCSIEGGLGWGRGQEVTKRDNEPRVHGFESAGKVISWRWGCRGHTPQSTFSLSRACPACVQVIEAAIESGVEDVEVVEGDDEGTSWVLTTPKDLMTLAGDGGDAGFVFRPVQHSGCR